MSRQSLIIEIYFPLLVIASTLSCGEPDLRLNRTDRRSIDTLVNNQLDSISPILDSICQANKEVVIQKAVDSIIAERKKKEERLRLNPPKNQ